MIYIVFLLFIFLILIIAAYQWQYFMIFSPTYYRNGDLGKDCEILSVTAKNAPNGPPIAILSGHPCRLTSGQQ